MKKINIEKEIGIKIVTGIPQDFSLLKPYTLTLKAE